MSKISEIPNTDQHNIHCYFLQDPGKPKVDETPTNRIVIVEIG